MANTSDRFFRGWLGGLASLLLLGLAAVGCSNGDGPPVVTGVGINAITINPQAPRAGDTITAAVDVQCDNCRGAAQTGTRNISWVSEWTLVGLELLGTDVQPGTNIVGDEIQVRAPEEGEAYLSVKVTFFDSSETLEVIEGAPFERLTHVQADLHFVVLNPNAPLITGISPLTGAQGSSVTFNASVQGASPSLDWTFGAGFNPPSSDGTSPTVQLVGEPGTYPIALEASNAFGTSVFTANFTITGEGDECEEINITTTGLPGGTVGTTYTADLAASGGSGSQTWSRTTGTLPPGLTLSTTAGTLIGTPSEDGTFTFTIAVEDSCPAGAQSDSQSFTVVIAPEGGCVPLVFTETTPPAGAVDTAYTHTFATTGGTGAVTFALTTGTLPEGLTLSATGVLSGTPATSGDFPITVTATDSCPTGASSDEFAVTLIIASGTSCDLLDITGSGALPNGQVGAGYEASISATGGFGVVSFSVTVGALPDGLVMNAGGSILGSPTTAGTSNFTVQAADSCPAGTQTVSEDFSITVVPASACNPLSIDESSAPLDGVVGSFYTFSLGTTSNGEGALSWAVSSGSLPVGLALSTAGSIEGTPTAEGTSNFDVTVTDSCTDGAQSDTATFTITITAPCTALAIDEATTPTDGSVGVAYNFSFVLSSIGVPPYIWGVSSGVLPDGLLLDNSGAISGTPTTAGTFTFSAQVTDSCGVSQSDTFVDTSITIDAGGCTALLIDGAQVPPDGQEELGYNFTYQVLSAEGTVTWSLDSGTLPPGLNLGSDGLVNGIPTLAGDYTFTVLATDSCAPVPQTATQTDTVTIAPGCPDLTVPVDTPPVGFVGVPYNYTPPFSGGVAPFDIRLQFPSQLPPGLGLADGTVSGTPTTEGLTSTTITFIDSCPGASQSQAQTYQFDIQPTPSCDPLALDAATPPVAQIGVPYSFQVTATGGFLPIVFVLDLISNPLPDGLSIDAAGLISGTPNGPVGDTTVTVRGTDSCPTGTQTDTEDYLITVELPTCDPLVWGADPPPAAAETVPLLWDLPISGGFGGITVSLNAGSDPLPDGLSIIGTQVVGAPTTAGTANLIFDATDSCPGGAQTLTSGTFVLVIDPAPCPVLDLIADLPPTGSQGFPYSYTVPDPGGVPPLNFTVGAGGDPLPTGLSLNAGTGSITGLAGEQGIFNVEIVVTDACASGSQTDSETYTIIITPP